MKLIPLRQFGPNKLHTRGVIFAVANDASHAGGAKMDEVRRRVRILDALENTKPEVAGMELEDADHEHLRKLMAEFPFAQATIELGKILDDIENAKEPPAAVARLVGRPKADSESD